MQSLSIIGVGAFGELAYTHLKAHFKLTLYDAHKNLSCFVDCHIAKTIQETCGNDIILFCIPVQAMEGTLRAIAPFLKNGQLVMDVGSVKTKPAQWMAEILPDTVDIIATHPVFGPESAKKGLEGANIVLCNIRGDRKNCVRNFLEQNFAFNIIESSVEEHDREMAYVQGLTHMIAKIYKLMNVPQMTQTSRTYDHLLAMVELIKNDSDELFRTIQTENPYVDQVKADFFAHVKSLEKTLHEPRES
jgi:prephenate dehydrogenase